VINRLFPRGCVLRSIFRKIFLMSEVGVWGGLARGRGSMEASLKGGSGRRAGEKKKWTED